jgi:hypothetical protein
MIGSIAFMDGLLAEVFRSFPQLYDKWQDIHLHILNIFRSLSEQHPLNIILGVLTIPSS